MYGYVNYDSGQLHYNDSGTGAPIVLLGSAGRSSRMFSELSELLSSTYRVLALDLPGSGGSSPLPAGSSMITLAESVLAVLDALEIDTSYLFGLHTGNKVGTAFAVRWPDRVRKFVLCGQTHSLVPDLSARNKSIGDRARTYSGNLDSSRESLVEWSMLAQRVSTIWWSEKFFGRDLSNLSLSIERAKSAVLDEIESSSSVRSMYEMNFAYDIAEDWKRLDVPTLILELVTPREQAMYGQQGNLVQDLIRGSRLMTLGAEGYKLTLEDRAADLAASIAGFCVSGSGDRHVRTAVE